MKRPKVSKPKTKKKVAKSKTTASKATIKTKERKKMSEIALMPAAESPQVLIPQNNRNSLTAQGQRTLNVLSSKDLHQEVDAPSGHSSLHGIAFFSGMLLDQA